MGKSTNYLQMKTQANKLRSTWSEVSNYPKHISSDEDVDWNPANQYVLMLERKIIEQDSVITILQDKLKSLEYLRKAWANGEIEN